MKSDDDLLTIIPPDQLKAFRRHAFNRINFGGEVVDEWPLGENLFETIFKKLCYIVDSNIPWKDYALSHPDKNFVVGKTLLDENDNLKGLLSKNIPYSNANIFILGLEHNSDGPQIILERLDEFYLNCLDTELLEIISKKRTRGTDATHKKYVNDRIENIRGERDVILRAMGISSLSELENNSQRAKLIRFELETDIRKHARSCQGNWLKSCFVADLCHAYILTDQTKRKCVEFNDESNINVFGDTHILRDALYLHVGVLTNDSELAEMTGYAGLECVSFL